MSVRVCDGADSELVMYLMIDGQPADDPEFAIESINCDCGSRFDDDRNDLVWPHRFVRPVEPERVMSDLPDIAGFL